MAYYPISDFRSAARRERDELAAQVRRLQAEVARLESEKNCLRGTVVHLQVENRMLSERIEAISKLVCR